LHASDDADVHVVVSESDAPTRPAEDADVVATLEPSTVTLNAPDVAPFDRIGLLGPGASMVNT
jgi:Pyruvate/2-oxoacid:ferredoxin oxidoreductase gamma subunit